MLSLTYFREDWLTQSNLGLWGYRILAIGGLLLSAAAFGRIFSEKWMWIFIGLLFGSELGLAILFKMNAAGKIFPEKITKILSYIYLHRCRDYIIYDESRGQFDKDVFYTLKPGQFKYDNMEFSTSYSVNKKGFRDDDNSLNFPEIIFLGDSYTMGWGVEQEESYAHILETALNKKTLNTGIASYGTAREFLTFEKTKHDSCQLVVLQFCPNDVNENRTFVENNFNLNISPKEKFDREVIWNKLYQKYYPLKYVHSAFYFLKYKLATASPSEFTINKPSIEGGISEEALNDFFVILKKIKNSFNGEVIIFNLGMNITQPAINQQFELYLKEQKIEGIHVFNSAEHLNKEDYLTLDTHLTKKGNEKLALGLKEFILKNNLIKK